MEQATETAVAEEGADEYGAGPTAPIAVELMTPIQPVR